MLYLTPSCSDFDRTTSQAFFKKTLDQATGLPFVPQMMLPSVHLARSCVQPPAGLAGLAATLAKPVPRVPLASCASYGVRLPPQSFSAPSAVDEGSSFSVKKQVCGPLTLCFKAGVYWSPVTSQCRHCALTWLTGLEALGLPDGPRSVRGVCQDLSDTFREPQVAWHSERGKGQQHGVLKIQERASRRSQ